MMPRLWTFGPVTWLSLCLTQNIAGQSFNLCDMFSAPTAEIKFNDVPVTGRVLFPEGVEIKLRCQDVAAASLITTTFSCDLQNNTRIQDLQISSNIARITFMGSDDFHLAICQCDIVDFFQCNRDTSEITLHILSSDGRSGIGVAGYAAIGTVGGLALTVSLMLLLIRMCSKRSGDKVAKTKVVKVKQQKEPDVVTSTQSFEDQCAELSEILSSANRSSLPGNESSAKKHPAFTDQSERVFKLPVVDTSIPSAPPVTEKCRIMPIPATQVSLPPPRINMPQGFRSVPGLATPFSKSGGSFNSVLKPMSNEFRSSPPDINSPPLAFTLFPPENSTFPPIGDSTPNKTTSSFHAFSSESPPTRIKPKAIPQLPPLVTKSSPSVIKVQAQVLSLLPASDTADR